MSIFDTLFYSVELALILHLAIGAVLRYPQWVRNGGSFHPAPAPVDELPTLPELLAEAAALVATPAPAMAATLAEPVAIAVVPVEVEQHQPDYQGMTSQQLRKECQKHGIQWRNARGKGQHLNKAQMLAELALTDL